MNVSFPVYIYGGSNKLWLNFEEDFDVKPGDVLKARVIEILNDSIILDLKGKLVSARTKEYFKQEYFKQDQEFFLTYRGVSKNGSIVFGLMREKDDILINGGRMVDFDSLIWELGLKPNETIKKVVKNIIKFQMPVTKENIRETLTVLSKLGDITEPSIAKSVFFLSKGTSPLKDAVDVFNHLVSDRGSIGKIVSEMSGLIQTLETKAAAADLLPETAELLSRFIRTFGFQVLTAKSNYQPEKEFTYLIKEILTNKPLVKLFELLKALTPNDAASKKPHSLSDAIAKTAFQMEKVPDAEITWQHFTDESINSIKKTVISGIKNITAQKLINIPYKKDAPAGFIFMQIPVALNGDYHTVNIKINKNSYLNKKKDYKKNTRIEFSIDTKNLNKLYVAADVSDERISGNIVISDDAEGERTQAEQVHKVKSLIEKHLPLLVNKLKQLGYSKVDIKIEVNRKVPGLTEMILGKGESSQVNTIDVKV